MRNRRAFLKFFGIGATVVAGTLLARTGGDRGGTPPTPPRTLQAVEDSQKRPIEYLEPEMTVEVDWIKDSTADKLVCMDAPPNRTWTTTGTSTGDPS